MFYAQFHRYINKRFKKKRSRGTCHDDGVQDKVLPNTTELDVKYSFNFMTQKNCIKMLWKILFDICRRAI